MYICQICKKTPATIHLTDIHNNVKKEVHICEACAAEKGFNLQGAASLPQLLGLAAKKVVNIPSGTPPAKQAEAELVCMKCGTTWSQFSDRGRLGCPHDYKAFDARIRQLVGGQAPAPLAADEKLHIGKTPGSRAGGNDQVLAIRSLEKKLRQAVAEENYEAAARFKTELDELRAAASRGEAH